MEKTVSTNQASLIFCLFTIALKMSALPTIMFSYSGNDSYITCLIALIFDFIGTIIILNIILKHPDKSFHQIIKETLGTVIAKIIYVILLIYFIAKCVLTLQELHDYFIATLFEELNPFYFLIVLGLITFYSSTKNFRTIGRVIELIFWPTFIGILFTLIFPIEDLQIEKLLPIFEQGFYPIYKGLARTTFAFGDYMILLVLMGKITFTKRSKKQMLFYTFSVLQFIFSFYVIFVGSFGKFSLNQTLALGELPLHNTTPATIGKLEWLTIIIWTVILLMNANILSVACKDTFDKLFNVSGKIISSIVPTVIIITTVALTYLQLETVIQIAITPVFSTISGGIQVLLVLILIISHTISSKRNKTTNDIPSQKKRKLKC